MQRFPVFLFLFGLAAVVHSARGQIVISEVMYNPRGSEQANEFVELYNLSATDSISLAGWRVGERGALDEIIAQTRGLLLAPQHFAVILDPTYFQSSTQYDYLIPSEALILTIDDNTLGNGGLSNSTAETVILVDAEGDTAALYTYSLGNGDGISDEKIELGGDDSVKNWANAFRVDGSPGFTNSVARAQSDGALVRSSLTITPAPLRENTPATISVLVQNAGRETLSNLSVDFDAIPVGREFGSPVYLGYVTSAQAVASNDTLRLYFTALPINAGRYRLLATLTIAGDANARNDTLSLPIAVGWRREIAVITEIMFEPASGAPEWVEIYNPQNFSLPLPDWTIEDESGSKGSITGSIFLPPQSYRVLTASKELASLYYLADSSIILLNRFPSLSNSGDAVLLRDFSGAVIDSIAYEKEWGEPGRSIEKIWHERNNTQRNWRSSVAVRGATPAAFNSVSPREYDLDLNRLRIEPEQPQYGATVQLEAIVHNQGRNPLSNFAVAIFYDTTGLANWNAAMALATIPIVREVFPEDSVIVPFSWHSPPPGKIQLMAEVYATADMAAENNRAFAFLQVGFPQHGLVINEIMFDPLEAQPEWVEIFNLQSVHVSLQNWVLEDEAQSRASIVERILIPPHGFRVLTASANLASRFDIQDSVIIVVQSFPALNQSGETVRLRDLNGNVIDSIAYDNSWGKTGKSIEKIWSERGNESSNWSPSLAPRGGTPGAFNSVSPREYDLEMRAVRFSPLRPRYGENVRIELSVANRGRNALANFSILIYYEPAGTQGWMQLGALTGNEELQSEDSLLMQFDWPQPPFGKNSIKVEVSEARDLIVENNRIVANLPVGYPAKSVIINEIYYGPRSNEIEWFELFNRSANPVYLSEWLWQDAEANAPAIFPDTAFVLLPGKYAVVSSRGKVPLLENEALHIQIPKWLTLNNDRESLKLYDFNGGRQDSVHFNAVWGGGIGSSLERINPNLFSQDSSNWSTCVDLKGATPGRQNSIFTSVIPNTASISVAPTPFSPDDDGIDDFAVFQMNLPVTTATVHLKIYDMRGRLIRQLLNTRAVGSRFEAIWNGRDEQGQPVRTGIYIVLLQAIRAEQGVLISAKTTVVLARAKN
ncbi:lamin tail domain-containing protein [candidate division KSB1 bacterium]|nr:lamin tail domain-containing protein [candidate division KSB1 bacterium]